MKCGPHKSSSCLKRSIVLIPSLNGNARLAQKSSPWKVRWRLTVHHWHSLAGWYGSLSTPALHTSYSIFQCFRVQGFGLKMFKNLEVSLTCLKICHPTPCRERDDVFRENNKIIAYYRKELKTFRKEQRRDAYRLARKVKLTKDLLSVMQEDRVQLISALTYSTTELKSLEQIVANMSETLNSSKNQILAADENLVQVIVCSRNQILAAAYENLVQVMFG